MTGAWPYKFFTPAEMQCKHTGECRMDPAFMQRLERLRERYGKPLVVTSGYRAPSHPVEARKPGGPGMHSRGIAVDIAIQGPEAVRLLDLALELGFTGIGVQQKGDGRFLHLDTRDTPAIWSY